MQNVVICWIEGNARIQLVLWRLAKGVDLKNSWHARLVQRWHVAVRAQRDYLK